MSATTAPTDAQTTPAAALASLQAAVLLAATTALATLTTLARQTDQPAVALKACTTLVHALKALPAVTVSLGLSQPPQPATRPAAASRADTAAANPSSPPAVTHPRPPVAPTRTPAQPPPPAHAHAAMLAPSPLRTSAPPAAGGGGPISAIDSSSMPDATSLYPNTAAAG
jgi:hypothetical protein